MLAVMDFQLWLPGALHFLRRMTVMRKHPDLARDEIGVILSTRYGFGRWGGAQHGSWASWRVSVSLHPLVQLPGVAGHHSASHDGESDQINQMTYDTLAKGKVEHSERQHAYNTQPVRKA